MNLKCLVKMKLIDFTQKQFSELEWFSFRYETILDFGTGMYR